MIKTFALLLDTYRELHAKRLFWIVLVVSGLVVGIFGAVDLTPKGEIKIFGWNSSLQFVALTLISRETFFRSLFSTLGLSLWLSWLATILAIVSTAGMFPDLLASGSIDLYLSRPIARVRLFLTKYLGGILFVALQVAIFCLGSFLVLGLRAGVWEPNLFLAVPLVLLMFSYLFAFCVLVGVLTRSTIAATLLTLLFWFVVFAVQKTEVFLLRTQTSDEIEIRQIDKQIADLNARQSAAPATEPVAANLSHLEKPPGTKSKKTDAGPAGFMANLFSRMLEARPATPQAQLADLRTQRHELSNHMVVPHAIAFGIAALLPKTGETIDLLTHVLVTRTNMQAFTTAEDERNPQFRSRGWRNKAVNDALDEKLRARSTTWVVGTSIIFELVVLSAAAWVFCRRDY